MTQLGWCSLLLRVHTTCVELLRINPNMHLQYLTFSEIAGDSDHYKWLCTHFTNCSVLLWLRNTIKHNEILSISNQNWLVAIQLTYLHLQIETYVSFEYQPICKDVNAGLCIALDRNNKKSTCVACGMYNVLIFIKRFASRFCQYTHFWCTIILTWYRFFCYSGALESLSIEDFCLGIMFPLAGWPVSRHMSCL